MARKGHSPERVLSKLQQVDVAVATGKSVRQAVREIFYSLKEVQILTKRWRHEYKTLRPHSSLGYRPPAPDSFMPWLQLAACPR